VELSIDQSCWSSYDLFTQLPSLRVLDVGRDLDRDDENPLKPYPVLNPLISFSIRSYAPKLLQAGLVGSPRSLRRFALPSSLLDSAELPSEYWSTFINLFFIELTMDEQDSELYDPLAQFPSLDTLHLHGANFLPPPLPSVHTLHLVDHRLEASTIFNYITATDPDSQLRELGVTHATGILDWTAMERFAIGRACREVGLELVDLFRRWS
jgi:hypothetical protein